MNKALKSSRKRMMGRNRSRAKSSTRRMKAIQVIEAFKKVIQSL